VGVSRGRAGNRGWLFWQTVRNYAAFYAVTSLWVDMARALGNAALIPLFGAPILRVLRRFQRRFRFDVTPVVISVTPQPRFKHRITRIARRCRGLENSRNSVREPDALGRSVTGRPAIRDRQGV